MASLVFSLVYLRATPTVADTSMETYHRVHYERLVNPSHTWDEIKAATDQIKSDESLMTEPRLRSETGFAEIRKAPRSGGSEALRVRRRAPRTRASTQW